MFGNYPSLTLYNRDGILLALALAATLITDNTSNIDKGAESAFRGHKIVLSLAGGLIFSFIKSERLNHPSVSLSTHSSNNDNEDAKEVRTISPPEQERETNP